MTTATYYTTAEIAALLGLSPRRVRVIAARLRVGSRRGHDHIYSEADLAYIKANRWIRPPK